MKRTLKFQPIVHTYTNSIHIHLLKVYPHDPRPTDNQKIIDCGLTGVLKTDSRMSAKSKPTV